ncbi:MAG: hypothetical protein KAR44_08610 [Candidatus Aegiribacteria sp.]|nr:hypothetical protein [Candidatus Aegiribacteria sp.]
MSKSRAYEIKFQIDQLKRELASIEEMSTPDSMTDAATCMACGHDAIIENLRSTAREHGTKGRAVLACWQERRDGSNPWWYSTTIIPNMLSYSIRDVKHLVPVLAFFSDIRVLLITQLLFEHYEGCSIENLASYTNMDTSDIEATISSLQDREYVRSSEGEYHLSSKGWQFFIVIAQLIHAQEQKLEPAKALKIFPAFQEVFGIYWGEYLGKEEDDALAQLDESGWLEKLYKDGITEADIREAIHEHNYNPN